MPASCVGGVRNVSFDLVPTDMERVELFTRLRSCARNFVSAEDDVQHLFGMPAVDLVAVVGPQDSGPQRLGAQ
jgi:hypothetical protein